MSLLDGFHSRWSVNELVNPKKPRSKGATLQPIVSILILLNAEECLFCLYLGSEFLPKRNVCTCNEIEICLYRLIHLYLQQLFWQGNIRVSDWESMPESYFPGPCSEYVSKWGAQTNLGGGFKYFYIFFIFTPTWERFPIWLIFFKGVETTNQKWMGFLHSPKWSGHFSVGIFFRGPQFGEKSSTIWVFSVAVYTFPETNSSPLKNGWLEYDRFLLGVCLFSFANC